MPQWSPSRWRPCLHLDRDGDGVACEWTTRSAAFLQRGRTPGAGPVPHPRGTHVP
ncbi:excalibur calcium-binding domain-containing protein [Streptomyces gardneri]|uniref:excalibur calcium-binding domain-containing protein n=1 Tax=Streptomyces gardneri TaxID=66892 RepID=UPI0036C100EE